MDDLIKRQDAINSIESHIRTGDELYPITETDKILNHAFEISASCIYNMPSAEPKQKTGKWLEKKRVYSEESYIEDWQSCCCSVCGHYDTRPYMYYFDEPNYYSYCGARMVGEEE